MNAHKLSLVIKVQAFDLFYTFGIKTAILNEDLWGLYLDFEILFYYSK